MDEGLNERIGLMLEGLPEPLRDPKKIVLGIVIILIIFWGLFLRPHPGTISAQITELDSGTAIIGATVELTAPDGRVEKTEYSDNAGRVFFKSVASGTEYSLFVEPGTTYKPATEYFSLNSGEAASLEVRVSRNYKLTVSLGKETVSVGAGCSASIPVIVVNDGNEPAELALVGGDSLGEWISSEQTTIGGKEEKQLTLEISVPADASGEKKGEVRARYTNEGANLEVNVVDKPDVSVSPKSISESLGSDNSFTKTIELSLKKGGDLEIDVECRVVGDDLQGKTKVTATDDMPLKEGNPKLFRADFGPFSSGTHLGKIICETSCGDYTILVEVTK
ncbi:hypothetical protein COX85_00740 [Candidatus Micrarchaeota archaeon CG_4_10_14_0_2_um_filter_55_9]|nr:MAG: hypothetical protein AUJ15_04025 [Candidatus Micrarchaeota archaeon CG1_02_55_41]PIO02946.1 MAG: hypothetical protein COT57_01420 [Candidatus Micrarchaeota archaeon CG09_land_8_20_14_0_10_55_25]PIZ92001.1 MAG: hypothetical protein COX85_00740 [Candidatus Micrarchaeota archaeon CG_4_10_14_0_2_um_filter_55_9]PJD01333.1 MAG: hypothetical protein COU38_01645 [Candidatus Micrarchaeota archaeon CG10_big_fil_rev_8_21_14_0_10_54_18]